MSSTIDSFQSRSSNSGILGKLTGLFFGGITKKVVADLLKNLRAANDSEIKLLEDLNAYDAFLISDIDKFEEMVNERRLLSNILDVIHQEMSVSSGSVSEDDKFYSDILHINNAFSYLIETNKKVHFKLDEIHNTILSKVSETISSDVLDEIWEGEEELWDDFYLQSKKS